MLENSEGKRNLGSLGKHTRKILNWALKKQGEKARNG
jgi:hypothetical protein